jgi:hypothetical protein
MSEFVSAEMLDPHLQKMLNAYGVIPERDPETAGRTRANFIAELDRYIAEPTIPRSRVGRPAGIFWIANLTGLMNGLIPLVGKRTAVFILITVLVFGLYLLGGVGISAYAASLSLPGDAMYPLKTTFENARVKLTTDPASQARLYLDYGARRLSEIQALIDQHRYADIARAVDEFEMDVQKALSAVQGLAQTDPARAAELNTDIAASLQADRDILTQMLPGVPPEVQATIQDAIRAVESATNEDDDDSGADMDDEDAQGTSTPMPTVSVTPERTITPTPTSTAAPGSMMPAPIPGSSNDNGNSNIGGDDDIDDDDDDIDDIDDVDDDD